MAFRHFGWFKPVSKPSFSGALTSAFRSRPTPVILVLLLFRYRASYLPHRLTLCSGIRDTPHSTSKYYCAAFMPGRLIANFPREYLQRSAFYLFIDGQASRGLVYWTDQLPAKSFFGKCQPALMCFSKAALSRHVKENYWKNSTEEYHRVGASGFVTSRRGARRVALLC